MHTILQATDLLNIHRLRHPVHVDGLHLWLDVHIDSNFVLSYTVIPVFFL